MANTKPSPFWTEVSFRNSRKTQQQDQVLYQVCPGVWPVALSHNMVPTATIFRHGTLEGATREGNELCTAPFPCYSALGKKITLHSNRLPACRTFSHVSSSQVTKLRFISCFCLVLFERECHCVTLTLWDILGGTRQIWLQKKDVSVGKTSFWIVSECLKYVWNSRGVTAHVFGSSTWQAEPGRLLVSSRPAKATQQSPVWKSKEIRKYKICPEHVTYVINIYSFPFSADIPPSCLPFFCPVSRQWVIA